MRKAHILMVEDERTILRVNAEFFEKLGYEVSAAASLREARLMASEKPPDLVLLDVMLDDGSGFDFIGDFRKASSAPIVYLTALGAQEDEERGFALGCDDYIVKPYNLNILAARVAALLRRAGVVTMGRLELAPLSVDRGAGVCTLMGERVSLSQLELRLLYFFMENFGKRLHRDYIYECVWGVNAADGSHTVKEHIYRLRKKLDMASPDSYFQITSESGAYLFGKVRY